MSRASIFAFFMAAILMMACSDDALRPQPDAAALLAAQGRSTTAIDLSLEPVIGITTTPASAPSRALIAPSFEMGVFVLSKLQYDSLRAGDPLWHKRADYQPYYNVRVREIAPGILEPDTALFFPLGARGVDGLGSGVHIFAYSPYRSDATLQQIIRGVPVHVPHDQTAFAADSLAMASKYVLWGEAEAYRAVTEPMPGQAVPVDQQRVEVQLQHKLARLKVNLKIPITRKSSAEYADVQRIRLSVGNCFSSGLYAALVDTFAVDSTYQTLRLLDDTDADKIRDDIALAYNKVRYGGDTVRRSATALTLPADSIHDMPFTVQLDCPDRVITLTRNTLTALPTLTAGSTTIVNITLHPQLSQNPGAVVTYK